MYKGFLSHAQITLAKPQILICVQEECILFTWDTV